MIDQKIETKLFGSGISFLLIVLYREVRDLTKKTEQLEQQLNKHIGCFSLPSQEGQPISEKKPDPVPEGQASGHATVASILMSIGGW